MNPPSDGTAAIVTLQHVITAGELALMTKIRDYRATRRKNPRTSDIAPAYAEYSRLIALGLIVQGQNGHCWLSLAAEGLLATCKIDNTHHFETTP